MLPQSIRVRIIFWFVAVTVFILSVFSLLVYVNLRTNLYENMDDLLELKAEGVIDYIDAYWRAKERSSIERGENVSVFMRINSPNFIAVAERWVEEIPTDSKLQDIMLLRIFDGRGHVLAASDHSRGKAPLAPRILQAVLRGQSYWETLKMKRQTTTGPHAIRTLTVPVVKKGHILCIVEISMPLTSRSAALRQLRESLSVLLFPAIFLAGLTGFWLARPILYPLEHMIETVRQITVENLRLRVQAPQARGEMRDLAATFNDMLGKLEQSFVSQKQIIQDISHELRTPLTILKGELELTLKRIRSQEEYEETLRSSLDEVNRIYRMVENLLTLARFDAQQMKLELGSYALDKILTGLVDDLHILAEEKKIKLVTSLAAEIRVTADETHLRRAFLNILENAIKYTPEGGTISVQLTGEPSAVRVQIEDTGIGIALENLPHVFDRFYRAEGSRSTRGFGLGLSLAKSIITAHNGQIEIQSQPGRGTTVFVTLPQTS